MKISKVNHKRMAVILKSDSVCKTGGILYKNEELLAKYIQDTLNKNAKRLYNVLQPPTDKAEMDSSCRRVLESFNKFMSGILKLSENGKDGSYQEQKEARISKQISAMGTYDRRDKNYQKNAEDIAEYLVHMHLRKSLCKTVKDGDTLVDIREVVKQLLIVFCAGRDYDRKYKVFSKKKELCSLLQTVNADYLKIEQSEQIAHSIQNQTVKVEVVDRDGKKLLKLANAADQKRRISEAKKKEYEEKNKELPPEKQKYVFDFMVSYARAEKEERQRLLMNIKKLLILFLYGKDEYFAINDESVFIGNSYQTQNVNQPLFCEEAKVLLDEKNGGKKLSKAEAKSYNDRMRAAARNSLIAHYREAVSQEGLKKEDLFWIGYFQNAVEEDIFEGSRVMISRLECEKLFKRVWRAFQSYIALKFVDFGKAVYHFVLPTEFLGTCSLDQVKPEFCDGITSFDYERIKAEENLERSMMKYIAFAMHIFSKASVKPEEKVEDVLGVKEAEVTNVLRANAGKNILAYFGGASKWTHFSECATDKEALFKEIKKYLGNLRNSSFHYTAAAKEGAADTDAVVMRMFEKEYSQLGAIYRKKYYSNNVWMFYSQTHIDQLMKYLYQSRRIATEQIPAFETVMKRAEFVEFWQKELKTDVAQKEIYWSTAYFMLKEIYYHGFLKQKNLVRSFENSLKHLKVKPEDKFALNNFSRRIEEIKNLPGNTSLTFGQLCQQILTDYNMQNPNRKEVEVNAGGMKEEKSYEHFPILLYQVIREAFKFYLKNLKISGGTVSDWLTSPKYEEKKTCDEEAFCANWTVGGFDGLGERIKGNAVYAGWYFAAHFLTPKYLNHLVGDIKEYITYVDGIKKREFLALDTPAAGQTESVKKRMETCKEILEVLEFVRNFCGQTSNVIGDYFKDDHEYATYISHFVDYGAEISAEGLKKFCKKPVMNGQNGKIGIYFDEEHPIAIRNVILAKLYGGEQLLSNALAPYKVKEAEIIEYYRNANELKAVFVSGTCSTAEERRRLTAYQQTKNRLELRNLVTYTEIINDMMSQLISWCYLRERDLMYFQLAVHYLHLFYGEEKQCGIDEKYRKLKTKKFEIEEGALLYQICALYSYSLPVYFERDGKIEGKTGNKYHYFIENYCGGEAEYKKVYEKGLELFQYMEEEEEIRKTRNYIDHFKYYANMDRSLLELYGEIFDRFFIYDLKLKKSVSFVFKNILKKYAVIADTVLKETERVYTISGKAGKYTRRCSAFALKSEHGLTANRYTYKLKEKNAKGKNKETTEVAAVSEQFLLQVASILKYKKESDI